MDTSINILEQFHFVRPWLLLGFLPAIMLTIWLWKKGLQNSRWDNIIDKNLLQHLLNTDNSSNQVTPLVILTIIWALSIIALAGPVWKKQPQPVYSSQDATIIILDLSLSMVAEDIKPNRVKRAKHKIIDIIKKRQQGQTALVVYAGDAHIVTPLTDDTATITNLVGALNPFIMPALGSNPEQAIEKATQLLKEVNISNGHIILLTDGVTEDDISLISNRLEKYQHRFSILAIGTIDGAPIPLPESAKRGSFLKDSVGNIIIASLPLNNLQQLANQNNGRLTELSVNDSDIDYLMEKPILNYEQQSLATGKTYDQWHEEGAWLLLLILPLAALLFRRGWLLVICISFTTLPSPPIAASVWDDVWFTPDQQAERSMAEKNYQDAAKLYSTPERKATAHYRNNDFEQTINQLNNIDTAAAHYNRANALAKLKKYSEAIEAYKQSLAINPDNEDTLFNKAIVEKLLQQENQESENSEKNQENNNQNQQENGNNQEQQNDKNQKQSNQHSKNQNNQADSQQDNKQTNDQENNELSQNANNENQELQNEKNENKSEQDEDQADIDKKQQNQDSQQESGNNDQQAAQSPMNDENEISDEEKQAFEQWLRRIPDDPAGLLRRKFQYEYEQNRRKNQYSKDEKIW